MSFPPVEHPLGVLGVVQFDHDGGVIEADEVFDVPDLCHPGGRVAKDHMSGAAIDSGAHEIGDATLRRRVTGACPAGVGVLNRPAEVSDVAGVLAKGLRRGAAKSSAKLRIGGCNVDRRPHRGGNWDGRRCRGRNWSGCRACGRRWPSPLHRPSRHQGGYG